MVRRRKLWLTFNSSVMPMAPCSCTASWLTCRQASAILIFAAEIERARSRASDAASDARERARSISAAKIKIADACRHVSQEAVQLHGAMGMTDELKVSHSFRRLTMIAQQFGDADHHLERFAQA